MPLVMVCRDDYRVTLNHQTSQRQHALGPQKGDISIRLPLMGWIFEDGRSRGREFPAHVPGAEKAMLT
jgi:hypothetical protein